EPPAVYGNAVHGRRTRNWAGEVIELAYQVQRIDSDAGAVPSSAELTAMARTIRRSGPAARQVAAARVMPRNTAPARSRTTPAAARPRQVPIATAPGRAATQRPLASTLAGAARRQA